MTTQTNQQSKWDSQGFSEWIEEVQTNSFKRKDLKMGFLDIDLSDVQEPSAVPGDAEYKLRIVDVRQADDKNGNPYILPRFEIPEEPSAKEFTKFLRLPHEGLDAKQLNSAKWQLKLFFDAFGVDPSSLNNVDDLVGEEGWAILGLEDSDQWGEQNFVKKFIVPK